MSERLKSDFTIYQEMAGKTRKPGMTREQRILMAALGLVGEAGEAMELMLRAEPSLSVQVHEVSNRASKLAEWVKKHCYHDKGVTREMVVKELGDWLWYIADFADVFEIDLAEVARENIKKLKARYPQGFAAGGGIRNDEDDSTRSQSASAA